MTGRRRLSSAAALVLTCALLAAACGSGSSDPKGAAAPPPDATVTYAPDLTADVFLPAQTGRAPLVVLVPGGSLLVLDLLAHNEDWVREKLEHVHLGFTEADLAARIKAAGFTHVSVSRAARDPQPPHFMTLVASARRGR